MAVSIAASAEGLSRMDGSDRKLWERTRLGKNVNKNVNKGKRGICDGSLQTPLMLFTRRAKPNGTFLRKSAIFESRHLNNNIEFYHRVFF